MRSLFLLAGALTAGAVFAFCAADPIANASAGTCLRVRDLGNLTPIDDKTLKATSRGQGNFIVRMRHVCRDFRQMGNYYSVRVLSNQECFDGDDVLQFRYGGVCFVESVAPAPK
jgi:hypothetical protein